MNTRSIIAFSKDYSEDPTSNHHVLRELAKTHRVLWLNSIATRRPNLASRRDLSRVRQKLVEFTRGPVNVENDLWVYTPLVLPFPHSPAAVRANRAILRAALRVLRWRLRIEEYQLWTFLPNVADYVGLPGQSLAVYYCVDEWSLFGYLDEEGTRAAEQALLERVDVVFAVTQSLAERKRARNPETYLAPHGVNHDLFARALAPETPIPPDLAPLPHPIIGYYGTLQDWVDLELLEFLARRHPEWSFALLGGIHVDTSKLARLPNVFLLGRKPHAQLPAYCKGFDVGIIPYVRQERLLRYVNPIKLREYLAAGLPVVATVPEAERYPQWCTLAQTPEEFELGLLERLRPEPPERRHERSAAMLNERWEVRVAEVAAHVAEIAKRAQRSRLAVGGGRSHRASDSGVS